jgi:hypothetical protein
MQPLLQWIGHNWVPIVLGFVALVQVINKATDRWDEVAGPAWKKWLLLLAEIGSVVTSRNFRGTLGLFKLPLNPYGGRATKRGPNPVIFPPGPPVIIVALLGGLVMTDGCAPTWEQNADRSIRAARSTAEAGWGVARAIYKARCGELIQSCNTVDSIDKCTPYATCKGERRSHALAFAGVLEMCAVAADALEGYERLKAAAETVEVGPKIPDNELAQRRAEVQERVDRATRSSVGFMRGLEVDGLVK